ncbi:VWA domain-containing protein [Planosporangium flavigriseum]|uniref:substrate-binding domain-containing protein n=1 Tax=Planosporangium flavigriseum TaxID=373681 RepID=UPI001439BEED|nr:substrate-binding domain-containing protein [Planosporangium flavigriseum]NJC63807.1 VWA domain-containing protein [Planosporangium flavigriseum]
MPGAGGQRTSGGLRAVAAAAAVLAIITVSWGGYRLFASPSCSNTVRLTVAAAREIVPAVQSTAAQWLETKPQVNDKCVAVDVTAAESADVAAAVAGQHDTVLTGVGQASGKSKVPDVWIPDSGTWLQRLRTAGPDWVPADAPSIARSPVVLAMPQPLAATLGWPDKKLTWADLLPKLTSDTRIRTGIVDPSRDASGTSGLLALTAAANAAGGANGQATQVAALRALATGKSTLRDDLLAKFPRATDAASLTSSVGAAPLSEQAVIAYNNGQPPVPLAAVFIDPAPMPLDYPFAVLPGLSADQTSAARALLVTLAGDPYRDRLARVGLRAADGSAGSGFTTTKGVPVTPSPAVKAPDPQILDKVLSTWSAVTLPGRMLAVIDVSGSMAEPVPTAGNATREQVTVEAARRGLALFDDSWAIGLWTFSTQLEGANDYRELVPVGLLANQRQQILGALGAVQPKIGGATGLYDTVLAAYKNVQEGWDPSRVNSIVLFTDGKNEDPQGLNLDQLTAELKKVMDPNRPIQIIAIGIGPEVSEAELKQITSTTGGGTFLAPDPSKIGEIFLKGISLRSSGR